MMSSSSVENNQQDNTVKIPPSNNLFLSFPPLTSLFQKKDAKTAKEQR